MAWYGKKLNLTQQKHAFTSQKKCTTTWNKPKKLKPDLVAFYGIRPGNRAGLFSKEKREEISKENTHTHTHTRLTALCLGLPG